MLPLAFSRKNTFKLLKWLKKNIPTTGKLQHQPNTWKLWEFSFIYFDLTKRETDSASKYLKTLFYSKHSHIHTLFLHLKTNICSRQHEDWRSHQPSEWQMIYSASEIKTTMAVTVARDHSQYLCCQVRNEKFKARVSNG